MKSHSIPIKGMHCASCALTIEHDLKKLPGVETASVNYALERAVVEYDEQKTDTEKLHASIRASGYEPAQEQVEDHAEKEDAALKSTPNKPHAGAHDHGSYASKKELFIAILLVLPLGMSMFFMPSIGTIGTYALWDLFLMVIAWILVVWFGRAFHIGTWHQLLRRRANMDTLVSLGTASALLWSTYAVFTHQHVYFEAAGFIITFLLIGKYLEHRQRMKAGEAIQSLLHLHAKQAHLIQKDGSIKDIDPSQLKLGDICLVKPGERVPIDGIIIKGSTTVDESMLTGEPIPVEREQGDPIIGATINGNGSIQMSVTVEPGKSTLDMIVKTVEHALTNKSPVERIVDRVSSIFVPIVICAAILTFFIWAFVLQYPLGGAIEIAVAVLIVACPCAMGLATPAAIMVGTGAGAKKGILIKDGSALELAHRIKAVVFDKTGTLTQGKPVVTDLFEDQDVKRSPFELLEIAGALERESEHPLATAILSYIQEQTAIKPEQQTAQNVQALVGKGIEGLYAGTPVLLGNEALMQERGVSIPAKLKEQSDTLRKEAKTILFIAKNKTLLGIIAVQDKVKDDAEKAISELKKLGIYTALITGDHLATANAVGREVGIDSIFADVSPNQKATIIKSMQKEHGHTAFVGDGINDAPALATADLGIAIGTGTDIAIATGQIILMQGSPQKAVDAIQLSKETFSAIKQNLFWAFIYNTVAIPLAAFGLLNPVIASGAMALSSVSVLVNSLRIKQKSLKRST